MRYLFALLAPPNNSSANSLINSPTEIRLDSNCPMRLQHASGTRIRCIAGLLLISVEAQFADIELRAGESYSVPNRGLVLIEGIGPSRMRISSTKNAHWFASSAPLIALAARVVGKFKLNQS